MHYDYLIVGAGLSGAIFAYLAKQQGKKCIVVEKRDHIGGQCYTDFQDGILVHKYGPHIFHTNRQDIWKFVNNITDFVPFVNSPIAINKGKVYSLPINMNTFYQLWGVSSPSQAQIKLAETILPNTKPSNLEEWALANVGKDVYEAVIKEYTRKQWGKACSELPASIIKRIPMRFIFQNNYFDDIYQGIPRDGYTKFIQLLLASVPVELNADYLKNKDYYDGLANKVVYTGALDAFFENKLGKLEWRSVSFVEKVFDTENYQGNAVVNYTDDTPYTRSVEHRHFMHNCSSPKTIVSFETPVIDDSNPSYPIRTKKNEDLCAEYNKLIDKDRYIFIGRLAEYKYYDMNRIIEMLFDNFSKGLYDV